MKCLISKGFKYLVALFIILSCVSVRAMARETNDTADQSNRITEKGNASKDETFDTTDELMSNDPKKSISSQDSASDKGKNEASSTKDSVKTEYTFEDSKIKVKAVLKKADAVSDQAELKVKEIPENTTEYKKYEKALLGQSGKALNCKNNLLLYDISFILNGKEVEPTDGTVEISMKFKKQQLSKELDVKNSKDLKVVHFIDNDVNKQETLTQTTNMGSSTTSFNMKSFSIVGLNNADSVNLGQSDTNFNYTNLLGEAINYGIVTDDFINEGYDAETNIAAKKGKCTTQTGNDLTNNVEQSFILGEVDDEFGIKGFDAYVQVPTEYASKIEKRDGGTITIDSSKTKAELVQEVQDMEDKLDEESIQLAAHEDTAAITYNSNTQKYIVDLTDYQDGTYYVTLDKKLIGHVLREDEKLVIKKRNKQTIVFNIPDSEIWYTKEDWSSGEKVVTYDTNDTITLPKFSINDGDNSGNYLTNKDSDMSSSIIWNIPNAKKVKTTGSITGIVLAPKATFYSESTSSGWLYAQTVRIGAGEWHNVYQKVVPVRQTDSVILKATKNIDGQAAKVNGFKFDLEEDSNGNWNKIQTQENYHSAVQFKITYGVEDFKTGETSHDYIYRISEEPVQENLSHYNYDKTVYYVKVTVNRTETVEDRISKVKYTASSPVYSRESTFGSSSIVERPVFNNTTKKTQNTDLLIKKIDAESNEALSGAIFTLYDVNVNKDGSLTKANSLMENNGPTSQDGTLTFTKLNYGSTYLLEETRAPNSYMKNGPWAVQIDENGKTTLTKVIATSSGNNTYTLSTDSKDIQSKTLEYKYPFEIGDEKKKDTLPETGGSGTKAYYTIGTLLSMLCIVYVVLKKKKGGLFKEKKNL